MLVIRRDYALASGAIGSLLPVFGDEAGPDSFAIALLKAVKGDAALVQNLGHRNSQTGRTTDVNKCLDVTHRSFPPAWTFDELPQEMASGFLRRKCHNS